MQAEDYIRAFCFPKMGMKDEKESLIQGMSASRLGKWEHLNFVRVGIKFLRLFLSVSFQVACALMKCTTFAAEFLLVCFLPAVIFFLNLFCFTLMSEILAHASLVLCAISCFAMP